MRRAGSSLLGGWARSVCLWLEAHCKPPHQLKGSLLGRSVLALTSALSSLPLAPSLRQQVELSTRSMVSYAASPISSVCHLALLSSLVAWGTTSTLTVVLESSCLLPWLSMLVSVNKENWVCCVPGGRLGGQVVHLCIVAAISLWR